MKLETLLEKEGITEQELKAIIKSAHAKPQRDEKIKVGNHKFSYGYFSDPHIGEVHFIEPLFEKMIYDFKQHAVDFVINPGDHVEGMSGRPGQIYDLSHIGFDAQVKYAAELYSQIEKPIYAIDGNHDMWYYQKNNGGAVVGEALQDKVKGFHNLGQMGAILDVNGIKIHLFHANDGTAYADSYKLQKLIESYTGGQKPNIVHSGHYHKSIYLFRRNVHGFESGTLCGQSNFMKGKKIQAHIGYGIVEVEHDNKGTVTALNHKFIPYYEPGDKVFKVKK